jgi:ParB family transcriptional regulator, chromosome partitioning protein
VTAEFRHISLANIEVPESHREVDQDVVRNLAASIDKLGLLQPVTVRKVTRGAYWVSTLVAGRHRLEAVRLLGHKDIRASVIDVDDVGARLCEIAENLHRAELSKLERASQIEEWRALTSEKVGKLSPPGSQPNEMGIRKTAEELGVDKKEVQNSSKIASIIPEAQEAAREAGLDDNQSALLKVASAPADKQVEAVKAIVKAKAEKPKRVVPSTTVDRLRALNWPEVRAIFDHRTIDDAAKAKAEKLKREPITIEGEVVASPPAPEIVSVEDSPSAADGACSVGTPPPASMADDLFDRIRPALDKMSDADVRAFLKAFALRGSSFLIDRPALTELAA